MAIKINSVSYVNKSDVFEGLDHAHDYFCDDYNEVSWGDASLTMVEMKNIKAYVRDKTEELSITDTNDSELMKEIDILFDRIKNIPDDVYFNFEG